MLLFLPIGGQCWQPSYRVRYIRITVVYTTVVLHITCRACVQHAPATTHLSLSCPVYRSPPWHNLQSRWSTLLTTSSEWFNPIHPIVPVWAQRIPHTCKPMGFYMEGLILGVILSTWFLLSAASYKVCRVNARTHQTGTCTSCAGVPCCRYGDESSSQRL